MKNNTNTQRQLAMKSLVLAMAGAGLLSLPQHVLANPTGGQVVAGNVTIRQESATKVGITQTTDKGIIDWQKFSIGANEHVQFYQPSASSVTLNRVVGQDPSQILGRLTANGQIFLVNPNGIFFGKNAQIDVAGLVASTHNIRNEDFLAGRYNFNIPGKPGAAVINEGSIRIADTGIAAFVAPSVANRGVIVARLGKVALAAANGFTLDFHGDQLLSFLVSDDVAKTAFDLEGQQLTSFAENSGRIEAQGGYVLLTAKAAESAIHGVINHSGVIEATTVGTKNGEIILAGGLHGLVSSTGTLDASGTSQGETGGNVTITGRQISLGAGSLIDTSGILGGGTIIVGGDYLGGKATNEQLAEFGISKESKETQTASHVQMAQGASIKADAIEEGNGGKVVIWADSELVFDGKISAKGGINAGAGGRVETSGKEKLVVGGTVDAGAANGSSGLWFLDPLDATIGGNLSTASFVNTLNNGTDVTISSDTGARPGSITLLSDLIKTAGANATLTLLSDGVIILNRGARIESRSGKLNVNINARHNVINPKYGLVAIGNDNNYAIASNGGDVDIEGLIQTYQGKAILTNGGAFRARTTPSPQQIDSRGFIGIGPTPLNSQDIYTIDTGGGNIGIRATGGTISLDNHALATQGAATLTAANVLAQPNILSFNMADEGRRQNLENGLGGLSGYGANFPGNDDNSTPVNISALSSNQGLNVLGRNFGNNVYLSNNGYMRLDRGDGSFTPYPLTNTNNPIIAAYFGDVDTRRGLGNVYYGTQATNNNNKAVLTWINTGYYSNGSDKRNTFQLQLENLGQEINMRMSYDQLQWTTGAASGGSGGLGGTVARAGFSIVGANQTVKFELPASGSQNDMLALAQLPGNTGYPGRWSFRLWSGANPPSKGDGRFEVAANSLVVKSDLGQFVTNNAFEVGVYPVRNASNSADGEAPDYRRGVDYGNRLANILALKYGLVSVFANEARIAPRYISPTNPIRSNQDALLVQFLTSFTFESAQGPDGFDVSRLTMEEKRLLSQTFRANGIDLSFSEFGAYGETLRERTSALQHDWDLRLQAALDEVSDAGGFLATAGNVYSSWEFWGNAAVNITSSSMDAVTMGASSAKTAATKMPTIVNLLKKIGVTKTASKQKIEAAIKIADSNIFKLGTLVFQNGMVVTSEALDIINSDKAILDQLKNIGITGADLAAGVRLDAIKAGKFTKLLGGKVAQMSTALASALISTMALEGDSPELKELGSVAAEFIPWAGPIWSQFKVAEEIANRSNPAEVKAFGNYLDLQEQYRQSIDQLYEDTLTSRLQMTIDAAYSFNKGPFNYSLNNF